MQNGGYCSGRAALALRWVVAGVVICFACLFALPAFAMSRSYYATGSLGSSPPAGPAGTTITVSGSGWPQPDGTQVTFGYLSNSVCSGVSASQIAVMSGGAFNGWLRWPTGLATGTYTICANINGSLATAGTFTALSSASPRIALSTTSVAAGQHFTITATNYLPAGTVVHFTWAAVSHVVRDLGSATSDENGTTVINVTAPSLAMESGEYSIQGSGGSGQPAPLFASASFTYTAQATPTPTPSPTQDPTPSQTVTPVASATVQQTALASPTAQGTQANGSGTVPATTPTATGSQPGAVGSGSLNTLYVVGGALGSLVFLLALLFIALRQRRKRKQAQRAPILPNPPQWTGGPFAPAAPLSQPGMMYPPGAPGMLPQAPGSQVWNAPPGAPPMSSPFAGPLTPAPAFPAEPAYAPGAGQPGTPYTPLPSVAQAFAGPAALNRNTPPPPLPGLPFFGQPTPQAVPAGDMPVGQPDQKLIARPLDPALETIRRQVQTGLFVDHRSHKDS